MGPGRGLRFVRWSIVSGGWEQLSAMTRVYEGIVTYLDVPIIIHRQFRECGSDGQGSPCRVTLIFLFPFWGMDTYSGWAGVT